MIDVPPDELWRGEHGPKLVDFKHKIEATQADFPGLVATSWYRDRYKNAAVGGDVFSQHLIGLAVDLDHPGATLETYRAIAQRALARGLSSVIYMTPTKSYLHIQYLAAPIDPNPPWPLIPEVGVWDLVQLAWYIVDRQRTQPFIREVLS